MPSKNNLRTLLKPKISRNKVENRSNLNVEN